MDTYYAHASASTAPSSATAGQPSPPNSPPISVSPRKSSKGFRDGASTSAVGIGSRGASGYGRSQSHSQSPPRTPPPNRSRNKRKGKQPVRPRRSPRRSPGAQQQPSRTAAAAANLIDAADARHSHGLSWNSTTRDSVVDNLLFSLDNISRGDVSNDNMNGPEDEERHRYLSSLASQFSMPKDTRARGHTHSSSTSDFDSRPINGDSPAKSTGSSTSKGRRSNSSSNFGISSFAGRAKANGKSSGIGRSSIDTQKQNDNGSLFGGKQSSDGGSTTRGYGSVLETSRLAWGGRSVSLDHIQGDADAPSVLDRGRPVPSVHSKYDSNDADGAAPEPTIAAGPRKKQNPSATGPVYVNAAPSTKQKPTTLRKITTQTDLRSQALPSPPISQEIRNQAEEFVRTSTMRGGGSLVPPATSNSQSSVAPSPGISQRRRDPSPPREKPGFFKRVFGGASSRAVSTPVERPSSNQVHHDSNDRANAPALSISRASAGSHAKGESRQTMSTAQNAAPQTLNKKPSSFFRRRKKSMSEPFQPPPLPVTSNITNTLNANLTVHKAEPSPSISSLRKVMDPFLSQDTPPMPSSVTGLKEDASRPDTRDSAAENSEDPDIFHTGYTPPPDASLAAPPPTSRDQEENPNLKMKVKKRRPDALATTGSQDLTSTTFLQHPGTAASNGTVRDPAQEGPKVSPLSDVTPSGSHQVEQILHRRPSTGDRIISQENSPIEGSNQAMRDFSAGTNVSLNLNEDGWYVKPHPAPERPPSKKSERLLLRPTASEELLNEREELSSIEGSQASPKENSENAPQPAPVSPVVEKFLHEPEPKFLLPTVTVDSGTLSRKSSDPTIIRVPSPLIDEGAEYKERARRIFEGDEEDVPKFDACSWLGERNTLSTKTLQAYMKLYDFSGLNVLAALRSLCSKLVLRGETQQVDRIITALSARWCECNSNHGFKAQDVVHTIFYSLILLNTDQHLADIGEKMSKSAYVKNTLPTIKRVVTDAAPHAFDESLKPTPTALRPTLPWTERKDSNPSLPTSPTVPTPDTDRADSTPTEANQSSAMNASLKRLSMRPGVTRNDSDTPDPALSSVSNALVNSPWTGSFRGWEAQMEEILKSFFNSIRSEPLPLHGAVMGDIMSGRNLSVVDLQNGLKRTGSVVSRTPSDNMSYRSKGDFRSMTARWQGRANRSRPKIYPASTVGSSRTSFDDGSGFWSPAMSSKYSFSKTLTSASVGSFQNPFSPMESFKHSMGFANALSQAIIREETNGGDSETFSMPGGLLEDETLALEGAPWAKEGLVKHKHHLETPDRKAKDRNWNDCFAVISKGKLTLFAFNTTTKTQSLGRKSHFGKSGKAASVTSTRVGGGDWMENAEQLEVFILRQTIASTLPPPGYSKARPHVWALSLPSGAVHLFQVGTPEIAEEYMSTANYWSARLSKEPLAGGVSNIEYGWSDSVVNTALVERPEAVNTPPSSMATRGHAHSMSTDRPSLQSSLRNSFDTGFGSAKTRLPGDKVMIHEWQPPSQSMMASQLMEVDQLKQLTAYVQASEEELEKHNELKHAIELAFSPRHPNHNKAMTNWQRKSDYLLREIVKFRTYIDSLSAAQKAKDAFYAKKADGRLSPVAKDEDYDVPGIERSMMASMAPRGIHTSG
ncbi:PH and SEC7 domain-containing protein C11E3.11c [Pseudocercospora fuligena]|uniref:PH and SEC7 domain-containing protein C11E3.11c n=1 Tax=Pseudocercospora fuligena TaxID=685502 RepID=A0A8H6RIQ5_9PEZI|nr:PH and SEC7 domain-containing protein C11E3.11c [Pseudocercospora fuligena]